MIGNSLEIELVRDYTRAQAPDLMRCVCCGALYFKNRPIHLLQDVCGRCADEIHLYVSAEKEIRK